MERYYSFANVDYCVTGPDDRMYQDDGILAPFRTEKKTSCHRVHLEVTDTLGEPEGPCVFTGAGIKVYYQNLTQVRYEGVHGKNWGNVYLRIRRHGDETCAQLKRSGLGEYINPKIVLTAMELEHQIVQHRGFLFHSSYIRCGDSAILFTAPSGTGKSTQAELWCRLRQAELINGDRSLVVMERSRATVHGVPYSGSSGVSKNVTLPLKAIVRLTQAPVTTIERLTGLAAFRHIWEGCCINTWNRNDMSLCMETVMETARKVPVFHLACTPDESAVRALESALSKLR